MPRRHPMKLHRADHTMVRRSHFHSFVTAEVEHAVTLCGQFSYGPLCKVIVYRITAVLGKGKYTGSRTCPDNEALPSGKVTLPNRLYPALSSGSSLTLSLSLSSLGSAVACRVPPDLSPPCHTCPPTYRRESGHHGTEGPHRHLRDWRPLQTWPSHEPGISDVLYP